MRDEDDKQRDAYNPGVSREQIERAEKMLGGLDMPLFMEKRNLGQDLRPGVLHDMTGTGLRADVRISPGAIDEDGRYVILSREPLPKMRSAEVSIEHLGRVKVLSGWLEASRPGRRDEDRLNGDVLKVAFFYPSEG